MKTASGTLVTYKMYIDGQWVSSASGQHFESHNPFTGKPWALIPRGNTEDIDRAVQAARKAFTSGEWPKMTASRRGALLRKLGDLILDKSKALAEIEVRDNGKLFAEMQGQLKFYEARVADMQREHKAVLQRLLPGLVSCARRWTARRRGGSAEAFDELHELVELKLLASNTAQAQRSRSGNSVLLEFFY